MSDLAKTHEDIYQIINKGSVANYSKGTPENIRNPLTAAAGIAKGVKMGADLYAEYNTSTSTIPSHD